MSRARPEIRKGSRVWVRIPERTPGESRSRRLEVKGTVRMVCMGRDGAPYVRVDLDDRELSAVPLRFEPGAVRKLGILDAIAEAADGPEEAADTEDPNAQSTGEGGTGSAGPPVPWTPPT